MQDIGVDTTCQPMLGKSSKVKFSPSVRMRSKAKLKDSLYPFTLPPILWTSKSLHGGLNDGVLINNHSKVVDKVAATLKPPLFNCGFWFFNEWNWVWRRRNEWLWGLGRTKRTRWFNYLRWVSTWSPKEDIVLEGSPSANGFPQEGKGWIKKRRLLEFFC